jgi:serine/threonine-protein kinase
VHALRIVHRDVKPANVLLVATGSARPHAYLTDFGIAVELDGPRLTETNVAIGTPGYMAPEQRRGELTTASDLYAVGAVARYMLTARPSEGDPMALERPEDVPQALWGLTTDLLAEDPADRPDAAATIARLQAPDLAWGPGAAGDVEVLQQVFDTSGGDTELLEPPTVVQQRPVDEGGDPPSSRSAPAVGAQSERAAPEAPRKRTGLLVAGAVTVAVVLVAAVLAWTSLSDGDPGGGDTATSPAVSSTSDSPGPSDSETGSSSPAEPSESAESTTSTGSVEVGTVVTRVGQPCQFSDVGLRETTSDGVEVICQQGDDGGYSWERAGS